MHWKNKLSVLPVQSPLTSQVFVTLSLKCEVAYSNLNISFCRLLMHSALQMVLAPSFWTGFNYK